MENKGGKQGSILSARDLCLTYKNADTPALDHINLDLPAGKISGLLGPNGAGKTSFLSIAAALIKPQSGRLSIDGLDVGRFHGRVRERIGFIPQDLALYPRLSGRENLEYYGAMYGVPHRQLSLRIDEYLDRFGLVAKADQRVSTYSGGMKRRINILAGVLHAPRLLFLDEPTVGIDAQSRNRILESSVEMNEQGISMVYTSHYMEEVQALCTHIAVMDQGRVIAQGNPGELVAGHTGCNNLSDLFLQLTGKALRD